MTHPTPKPICTTVPLKGLSKDFKILHFTDLHACALDDVEKASMPDYRRDYIPPRVWLFGGGRPYPSEAALPALLRYGEELAADLVLMTGDILDFPSEANLSLLEACIRDCSVPVLYVTGNHDWSFADDYHTAAARARYLTRVESISRSRDGLCYFENDSLLICAIDDSCDSVRPETLEAYRTAAARAKESGKALILAMHVPLHAETLVEDTVRVWRQELTVGEGAFGSDDPATMAFFNAVAKDTALAPDAVIAGHLHFDHEDQLENGVPQYVTDIACDGHCRVITLTPAD